MAREAQQALHDSGAGTDMFAGGANSTAVTGAPARLGFEATKGDMITLGDFNADGKFDGRDLYLMARGTSLADSRTSETLTGNFADALRNGVLRKNAALDQLQATATAQQKQEASANVANDPTGRNAFNKFDVNRDGKVNRQDAGVVDSFVGRDYRKLEDQLSAVVATNVNPAGTRFLGDPTADATTPRRGISLVDVELNDDAVITHVASGADNTSDFKLIRRALGSALLDGDADFDGRVGARDVLALRRGFGQQDTKWSQGDFDFNGKTSLSDYIALRRNLGRTAGTDEAPSATVAVRPTQAASLTGRDPGTVAGAKGQAELVVNVATGEVRLVGSGDGGITGYEIASDGASLLPSNWLSLAGKGEGEWATLGSLSSDLAEANLGDGSIVAGPEGLSLGSIFNTASAAGNITFSYMDGSMSLREGRVSFVPEPGSMGLILGVAGGVLLRHRRRHSGAASAGK